MRKKLKKEKSNVEIRQDKEVIKEKVKEFLVRAHSFQEVGTEELPDENYDILHFWFWFSYYLLAAL